jgi:hypothetical protein
MPGPLPFRPHDDPEQHSRDEGDNDEDEDEDVDESVRPIDFPTVHF